MWFEFALLGGLFSGILTLINRYQLKNKIDGWTYSFYFSVVCSIFTLPLFLHYFNFAELKPDLLLILAVSFLIVLFNYLTFSSFKYLSPSWGSVLSKTKYIWLMLFGILFLSDYTTWQQNIGIVLIVFGSILTVRGKNKISKKGSLFALGAALCLALYGILTKSLTTRVNIFMLTFLFFFIPAIINYFIMPNSRKRIKENIKNISIKLMLLVGFFGALMNYLLIESLSLGNATAVYSLFEISIVVILIGEFFILEEKENLSTKIISIILVVIGAILIRN